MKREENELRRALDARSGSPSPEFQARLSSALAAGRPAARTTPAIALVAAACLAIAMVGVLMLSRQGPHVNVGPPPASASPTQSTPTPPQSTPTPPLTCTFCPIQMPTDAQISAPSANVVWALVAEEYLARSTDSGATWEQRPLPGAISGYPRPEISFVSDHEGWFTSGGSPETQCNAEVVGVWHTVDAGATWHSLGTNGVSDRQCKGLLSFADSTHGFMDAWDPNHPPVIYRTTDGGQSWSASAPIPDPPGFKTVGAGFVLQPGLVHAYGPALLLPAVSPDGGVQYVFRSTDGGATWIYQASRPTHGGFAIVTASRWLQILPGQSVETTDAGKSWHPYASDYAQAAGGAPDVVFADPLVGYATVRGGISRTVDGGGHWAAIETPGTGVTTTG